MTYHTRQAAKIVTIFFTLCSLSFTYISSPPDGEQVYRAHCAKCHGADGSKGKPGKNKLDQSKMNLEAIVLQIENGKKGMPSFKKKLSEDEVAAVTTYIQTFRK